MSELALQALPVSDSLTGPIKLLPVPWRDPHNVPPEELAKFINSLELACEQNPTNADVRTCLGMAHAMNFDVYRSMDALEEARTLEPQNFWAQMKYAELYYRLRALNKAEDETTRALELATNGWELSVARKQLGIIRELMRHGTQKPEWTKPLSSPLIMLAAMAVICAILMVVK